MQEFTFIFTEQELNILVSGLAELPAKVSFDLINKIHKEVKEQSEEKKEQSEEKQ